MEKDKLREKLTNLGMQACSDCGYDCEPPRRKMLCPSDVDQILAKAREAVKGAGLTDEKIMEEVGLDYTDEPLSDEDEADMIDYRFIAEAQTKAILKALEGE